MRNNKLCENFGIAVYSKYFNSRATLLKKFIMLSMQLQKLSSL